MVTLVLYGHSFEPLTPEVMEKAGKVSLNLSHLATPKLRWKGIQGSIYHLISSCHFEGHHLSFSVR